jgi:hypothetical protein
MIEIPFIRLDERVFAHQLSKARKDKENRIFGKQSI